MVGTPIGNLSDLTERARDVFSRVALVAAEDTRQTRKLLSHLGVRPRLISCHEHNELTATGPILDALSGGQDVAIATDAGTPALSDPGARLVAAVRQGGFEVVPIPGPSAITAALSIAGMPADSFLFRGFLPSKKGERKKALEAASNLPYTLVFFEAPHRLRELIADMLEVLGNRKMTLARELTKLHETIISGTVVQIMEEVLSTDVKGEITLVVEGAPQEKPGSKGDEEAVRRVLSIMLKTVSVKEAAEVLSKAAGINKSLAYTLALEVKE